MRYLVLTPAAPLLVALGFLTGLSFYFHTHAWDYSDGYKIGYSAGLAYSHDYENRMASAGLCVYADLACKNPLQISKGMKSAKGQ